MFHYLDFYSHIIIALWQYYNETQSQQYSLARIVPFLGNGLLTFLIPINVLQGPVI